MKNINGWWTVDHDHASGWGMKEAWIRNTFGPEGEKWRSFSSIFAYNVKYENADKWPGLRDGDMIWPLRWGFANKNDALLFLLAKSSL
jgi:hypothetical protein